MALFFLVVLLLNFGESISFLLNTTTTGLTSYEFQLLSQFVLDEKQLRHQLESDFASLQQELKDTKSELGTVKSLLGEQSKKYESFRHKLDIEASNRSQLQQELTGLTKHFQNLSVAFTGTHTNGPVFTGPNKTGRKF